MPPPPPPPPISPRALYLAVCLPVRLGIVLGAYLTLAGWRLPWVLLGLGLSAGFAFQAYDGRRTTGAFGQPVWWADLRWVHAILHGAFGMLALVGASPALACAPLLLDVGVSVGYAFAAYTTSRRRRRRRRPRAEQKLRAHV